MDPHVWELLEEGNDEDEVAVILRLGRPGGVPEGVRLVTQFGDIATVRLRRGAIPDIRASDAVASLKAPDPPFAPEPEVDFLGPSEDFLESFPWVDDRRPHDESATGRGVVVGVIDWGCDFAHPDFRHSDGRTRLLALWDQSARPASGAPNRYGYGEIHTAETINRALATDDPYAELGYHPADSDVDQNGTHGTHVLSIAAGNGGGGGPVGVAPEADLIFVQHSMLDPTGTSNLGDSVTLLEAVHFIEQTAGDRPWVVNISMGRHGGPHDGSTLVEQGLDAALRAAPGRIACQSTGNYRDRRIHSSGQLQPAEERTLGWEIDAIDVTPNELEVWYSGQDVFVVEVRSPSGALSRRVALGERAFLTLDSRKIGTIYHRANEPNNLANHIVIILYPDAPEGTWEVTIIAQDVVDGRFHAWIERDALCPRCQSRFRPEDAIPTSTTGTIANGRRTVAVGSYDSHSPERELAPFSSWGPTIDGRLKPNLVAPGVHVLAARSAPRDPHGETPLLTRKSGTSMASPHVAGTCALMFQVAPRPLRVEETRNLLLASARRVAVPQELANRIGSGYLDMDRAIEATRRVGEQGVELQPQLHTSNGEVAMNDEDRITVTEASDQEFFEHEDDAVEPDIEVSLSSDDEELPSLVATMGPSAPMQEQTRGLGALTIGGTEYPVVPSSDTPEHTATNLDDALRFAISQTGAHAVIEGNMLSSPNFAVRRWEPQAPLPSRMPLVVGFDHTTEMCSLVFDGGRTVYFPSNPTARTRRWVTIPRVSEFYGLPRGDRAAHRDRWMRRIAAAGVGYTRVHLDALSMPALRLLLAHFAANTVRVRDIDQPEKRFRGAVTQGVTIPILGYPISEPECYLPVIAEVEGKLETINAYDLAAGISVGPIQFNVKRGALFRFLWNLWENDRDLFNQELGGPLGWSMQGDGRHPDLLINAGTPEVVTLHGRASTHDETRNYGFFQSGIPGRTDFDDIDQAFRRRTAERFRNVVVWPHVQHMVGETSAWWLAPGLTIVHSAGIPALDPRNPDRDAFVLKAMLLSSYVRFSGYLPRIVDELGRWTSLADKLANWEQALEAALDPSRFPESRRRIVGEHREHLRRRLRNQRTHAERVHDAILRLADARSGEQEEEASEDYRGASEDYRGPHADEEQEQRVESAGSDLDSDDSEAAAETYAGDPRSEEPESLEGEEQPEEAGSLAEEEEVSEEDIPEQDTPTPWNVYMYVVGTDVSGRGDFNVMRELLQDETDYEYPWVAITYDFKKGESDPARGELRKSWKRSASSGVVHQTYPLGTSFDVVYRDIEALPANNQRIRHLHFLTHFGNDTIWYRPHTGSSTADLHGIDRPAFASAFASDAVVKIHGCQQDRELTRAIAEFCGTSSATRRREVLRQVRDRIGRSYPFQLADLIDRPVWATPLGAYAIYECSYLPDREKGRRFCVETGRSSTHTFQRTLSFYQANYEQIFDRAPGEPIFDATFHMKYKPRLQSPASLSPSPCASSVSPGGLVTEGDTEQELYETVRQATTDGRVSVPELIYLADDAVSTGVVSSPASLLGHVLPKADIAAPVTQADMEAFSRLSPAVIFDAFTTGKYPELRNRLEQVFEVVAWPLSPIDRKLYPGDFEFRRALGEGNLAHVHMLVTGEVIPAQELEVVGLRAESGRLGDYAQVVEGGVFPHAAVDGFARRLTREDGRLDRDTIIVRLRSSDTSPATQPSESELPSEAIPAERLQWEDASPEQLEFMRAVYERQVSRAQRRGSFVGDVPEAELEVIEGRHRARRAAAADCRALLDAARADLDREKRAGVPHAQAVEGIHLVSAYRSASRQFLNWQHNFPRYYHQTRERRAGMDGGEHGEAAAEYLSRYIGERLAAPGYSLHNDGRAVDFGTREGGEDLGANTNAASIRQWRQSWLFEWLTGNAARFNYYENLSIDEPWHWEHRRVGGTARGRTVDNESYASRERTEATDVHEHIPPVAPAPPESDLESEPVAESIDVQRAVRLNRQYAQWLGWQPHIDRIAGLLGFTTFTPSEAEFALAVGRWQSQQGLPEDGVIGPETWARMRAALALGQTPPTPTPGPTIAAGAPLSSDQIRSVAQSQWDSHPAIQRHFGNQFERYLEMFLPYYARGIQNPAQYIADNIVTVSFFGHRTPAHRDMVAPLQAAENALRSRGITPAISSFWSFNPRPIRGTTLSLSKHATGRAVDINPEGNPLIADQDDIRVIQAVTGVDLGRRQPADVMRQASQLFQRAFNQQWIDRRQAHQGDAQLMQSIQRRRSVLDSYARTGFFNLEQPLIDALVSAGFVWGGNWERRKDFMHFELPGW